MDCQSWWVEELLVLEVYRECTGKMGGIRERTQRIEFMGSGCCFQQ